MILLKWHLLTQWLCLQFPSMMIWWSFQSIQSDEAFVLNSPQKAHIIDKAYCVGHFASLKDCPDNFLALDANLHNQFDGRSVTPSGVPLFVIIPEQITSATISSSIPSKVFTNVKVGIHFYNETAAAAIRDSHFKSFEGGSHQSVHMFLAAAHPELFVQCLNWKGVFSLIFLSFSPDYVSLLPARRTLELWGQESPAFLPDLVIPYDESVLGCFRILSPPVTSPPISSREDRHLFKQKKIWSPAPDPHVMKKGGRRSPPLPPAPSGR